MNELIIRSGSHSGAFFCHKVEVKIDRYRSAREKYNFFFAKSRVCIPRAPFPGVSQPNHRLWLAPIQYHHSHATSDQSVWTLRLSEIGTRRVSMWVATADLRDFLQPERWIHALLWTLQPRLRRTRLAYEILGTAARLHFWPWTAWSFQWMNTSWSASQSWGSQGLPTVRPSHLWSGYKWAKKLMRFSHVTIADINKSSRCKITKRVLGCLSRKSYVEIEGSSSPSRRTKQVSWSPCLEQPSSFLALMDRRILHSHPCMVHWASLAASQPEHMINRSGKGHFVKIGTEAKSTNQYLEECNRGASIEKWG